MNENTNTLAKLGMDLARLIDALRSTLHSLDQMAKLGRIPENNQGARDARELLIELGEGL